MTRASCFCLACLFLACWSHAVRAGEGDYERRVVTRLEDNQVEGETLRLKAGGQEFLALLVEASGGAGEKAAVILHSMGTHADWPEIISPLRLTLPRRGWTTLSLQLPVFAPGTPLSEYGGTLAEAGARARSGVDYLLDRGFSDIVVIGYSFGAAAAVTCLIKNRAGVSALVGISMQPRPFLSPVFDLMDHLGRLMLPVLDIYGSRDYAEVSRSADDRRLAGKRNGNRFYEQIVINGADHYYTDKEPELINEITSWLDKLSVITESGSE